MGAIASEPKPPLNSIPAAMPNPRSIADGLPADGLSLDRLIEILRQDYARFPKDQTFAIYSPEVYFKDPTSEFRGVDRYRQTIAFIDRWFGDPRLELHQIEAQTTAEGNRLIRTDWTLHWTTPLPWKPRIAIAGWSELGLNEANLIVSHVDFWHNSIAQVLRQHFAFS